MQEAILYYCHQEREGEREGISSASVLCNINQHDVESINDNHYAASSVQPKSQPKHLELETSTLQHRKLNQEAESNAIKLLFDTHGRQENTYLDSFHFLC